MTDDPTAPQASAPAPQAREPREGERIAKLLARAGVASRREVERMIAEGRVAVDGAVLDTPATVLTSLHGVTVDGQPVARAEPTRLFRFHKPPGLITAERDPGGRPTIYNALVNALPPGAPRVMPVGRLDFSTEGLLLMTNDGEAKRLLELPTNGVPRTYRARTFGAVSQAQLEELIEGITVEGVRYGRIDANLERSTGRNQWIELTLTEGKNREVRRVLEHLGLEVSRLIRVAYGPFTLSGLPRGGADEVRREELERFLASVRRKVGGPAGTTGEEIGGAGETQVSAPSVSSAPAQIVAGIDALRGKIRNGFRALPAQAARFVRPGAGDGEGPAKGGRGSVSTPGGARTDRPSAAAGRSGRRDAGIGGRLGPAAAPGANQARAREDSGDDRRGRPPAAGRALPARTTGDDRREGKGEIRATPAAARTVPAKGKWGDKRRGRDVLHAETARGDKPRGARLDQAGGRSMSLRDRQAADARGAGNGADNDAGGARAASSPARAALVKGKWSDKRGGGTGARTGARGTGRQHRDERGQAGEPASRGASRPDPRKDRPDKRGSERGAGLSVAPSRGSDRQAIREDKREGWVSPPARAGSRSDARKDSRSDVRSGPRPVPGQGRSDGGGGRTSTARSSSPSRGPNRPHPRTGGVSGKGPSGKGPGGKSPAGKGPPGKGGKGRSR